MIKIIIADDHPVVRKGLKDIIRDAANMQVVDEARNAKEVLEKAQKEDCDIVLLDISMPGKSGLDVLKEIKSDDVLKDIPVIVISGSDDLGDVEKSYQNHAAAYVTKCKCLDRMNALVEALDKFWFRHAKLPQN